MDQQSKSEYKYFFHHITHELVSPATASTFLLSSAALVELRNASHNSQTMKLLSGRPANSNNLCTNTQVLLIQQDLKIQNYLLLSLFIKLFNIPEVLFLKSLFFSDFKMLMLMMMYF